jgi:hypothetical protein
MILVPYDDKRAKELFSAIESTFVAHMQSLGESIAGLRNVLYVDAVTLVGKNASDNDVIECVRERILVGTANSNISCSERSLVVNEIIGVIIACRERFSNALVQRSV